MPGGGETGREAHHSSSVCGDLTLALSPAGTTRLHTGRYTRRQALNDGCIAPDEVRDGALSLICNDTLSGHSDEHAHTIAGAPSLKGKF